MVFYQIFDFDVRKVFNIFLLLNVSCKKMDFSFYSHPDSASFFVSIIAIHSPVATDSINFCCERMGNFHVSRVAIHAD